MSIEKKRKRNFLLNKAQALLLRNGVTEADRLQAKGLSDEADVLEEEILQDEERAMQRAEEFRLAPPRSQPGDGTPGIAEWRAANFIGGPQSDPRGLARSANSPEKRSFEQFVRFGTPYQETRDLGTVTGGSITAGSQLIPQAFYPVLIDARKMWGKLIEILNVRESDNGAPMKIALDDDTANAGHLIGEDTQVVENDPSLNGTQLSTDQCTVDLVTASIAELQDSYFDIDAWLRDKFGKRYYRGLTKMVTNGTFAGSPAVAQNIQSILTGSPVGKTSAVANDILYADIAGLWGALDPSYLETASWVMNYSTRTLLMGKTDSLGRPLYIPNPTTGAFDRLLGCPIILNQFMPNATGGNLAVQFGDFSQVYLLRNVMPGLAIMRLNERYIDKGMIGFIGFFRSGGIVTDAGTHPIVSLQQHS